MSKRKPPPSLGILSPKKRKNLDKFAEWQIMKQEVDAWDRLITPILHLQGFRHVRIFAVGSPRKMQVVTKGVLKEIPQFKVMKRDVRTASHQYWMEDFILLEWQNSRFVAPDEE